VEELMNATIRKGIIAAVTMAAAATIPTMVNADNARDARWSDDLQAVGLVNGSKRLVSWGHVRRRHRLPGAERQAVRGRQPRRHLHPVD
jgi:hypothetical protein